MEVKADDAGELAGLVVEKSAESKKCLRKELEHEALIPSHIQDMRSMKGRRQYDEISKRRDINVRSALHVELGFRSTEHYAIPLNKLKVRSVILDPIAMSPCRVYGGCRISRPWMGSRLYL